MSATATEVHHLIGGEPVPAAAGETFETRDPHDDSVVARVARGGAEDAARAVAAARRAFDEGPWPRMSTAERRRLLHALADLVEVNADELAALVYSARGADVHTVLVDGRVVVRDGAVTTLDEQAIRAHAQDRAERARSIAGV